MPRHPRHELGQTLMLALGDFRQRLDTDLAATDFPGLRHHHRAVFMHLERHGASRSVDLAAAAGVTPQSMMKSVHELEDLGLVSRSADPADSRAKLIEFTPAGKRLIAQLSEATERVWRQYSAMVGEAELDGAMTTLRRLVQLCAEDAA